MIPGRGGVATAVSMPSYAAGLPFLLPLLALLLALALLFASSFSGIYFSGAWCSY